MELQRSLYIITSRPSTISPSKQLTSAKKGKIGRRQESQEHGDDCASRAVHRQHRRVNSSTCTTQPVQRQHPSTTPPSNKLMSAEQRMIGWRREPQTYNAACTPQAVHRHHRRVNSKIRESVESCRQSKLGGKSRHSCESRTLAHSNSQVLIRASISSRLLIIFMFENERSTSSQSVMLSLKGLPVYKNLTARNATIRAST